MYSKLNFITLPIYLSILANYFISPTYTYTPIKLKKCASLVLQNNITLQKPQSLLDIYEGKESIPSLYEYLGGRIEDTKSQLWHNSCTTIVCGWDGSFGSKCTILQDGQNNLSYGKACHPIKIQLFICLKYN